MADETSREMTILAYHALEDKKAADISVIDIGHVSVIADYFLIAQVKTATRFRRWPIMSQRRSVKPVLSRRTRKGTRMRTGCSLISAT